MVKAGEKIIFIIGGALIKAAGIWRTANYDEGDNFGVSGDRLRVLAAAHLYKNNKNLFFIALGGRGQLKNISGSPAVAKIIKRELINLGVPVGKIAVEEKSGNTYEQLAALKNIIKKNKLKKFFVISNRYHFPRIKAMLDLAPGLNGFKNKAKFISAENVVIKYGENKWKKIIDKARRSSAMKERIKLEEAGVKQIKQGTYQYGNKNCQ